jgi:excisionase family DNA binding protein
MDEKDGRPPLRTPEAARRLNVSEQAVRGALRRGELDGFRLGGQWRIMPESVDRLLRGNAA